MPSSTAVLFELTRACSFLLFLIVLCSESDFLQQLQLSDARVGREDSMCGDVDNGRQAAAAGVWLRCLLG